MGPLFNTEKLRDNNGKLMEVPPMYPIKQCISDREVGTVVPGCDYYEYIDKAIEYDFGVIDENAPIFSGYKCFKC